MTRLLAIALVLLYSGFLTAVAACPMALRKDPHHCCPSRKPPKTALPGCPMGDCLTDGVTSSAHPRAQVVALALASPAFAPVVAFAWADAVFVGDQPLPRAESLYLKNRVLRI